MRIGCAECPNIMQVPDGTGRTARILCPTCQSGGGGDGPPAGTRLDRYRLIEQVGEGRFGSVWRARDEELERTVAVKVFDPNTVNWERLRREAKAASQLNHPGLVRVFDVGRHRKWPYLVTEFIRGIDLERYLRETTINLRDAAEFCVELADAMAHAHEAGVFHRDIKPENILVDEAGGLHIADFGTATTDDGSVTLTAVGEIIGTPSYMCPEMARGDARYPTPLYDVYSLGGVLYRMLTGVPPFSGQRDIVVALVRSQSPPDLPETIPAELARICHKAMAREAENRYQSVQDFGADLTNAIESDWGHIPIVAPPEVAVPDVVPEPLPVDTETVAVSTASEWPRRVAIIAIAVLVPVLLVVIFALTGNRPATPGLVLESDTPIVRISTDYPADRVRVIPLVGKSCMPKRSMPWIEPRATGMERVIEVGPLQPGHYLVIAQAGDRFHEVMRTVPQHDTNPGRFPHNSWTVVDSRTVAWPEIRLKTNAEVYQELDPEINMLQVDGGEAWVGRPDKPQGPASYYQVRLAAYAMSELPLSRDVYRRIMSDHAEVTMTDGDDHSPATGLDIDEVLYALERIGCRLPIEHELEFAITAGAEDAPIDSVLPQPASTDVGPFRHRGLRSGVCDLSWSNPMPDKCKAGKDGNYLPGVRMRLSARGPVDLRSGKPWRQARDLRRRREVQYARLREAVFLGFRACRSRQPKWDWALDVIQEPSHWASP